MIDFEMTNLKYSNSQWIEMGLWLDKHMPNPPLPEPQRWRFGQDQDSNTDNYRFGIRFANDYDATLFALRWIQ
jgi:hypothetical protein